MDKDRNGNNLDAGGNFILKLLLFPLWVIKKILLILIVFFGIKKLINYIKK